MPSGAIPSDLVLAAVRACSTSAGSDRTIHRLLQGIRRQEPIAGSGATGPARDQPFLSTSHHSPLAVRLDSQPHVACCPDTHPIRRQDDGLLRELPSTQSRRVRM